MDILGKRKKKSLSQIGLLRLPETWMTTQKQYGDRFCLSCSIFYIRVCGCCRHPLAGISSALETHETVMWIELTQQ